MTRIFYGSVRFNEETDQMRPEAQVSKGEDNTNIDIVLNFLNYQFFLASFVKRLAPFTFFENGRCQCHYLERNT